MRSVRNRYRDDGINCDDGINLSLHFPPAKALFSQEFLRKNTLAARTIYAGKITG
jgi:hypothetical protein